MLIFPRHLRVAREFVERHPDQRFVLDHVAKLTLRPAEMGRADHDRLLAVGFSDEDVLALTEVAAYYAYVNRIADGLGVQLES